MKIPKIEFDIYRKMNDTNLQKLNKLLCKDIKIDLFVPIKIPELANIDEYNSTSGYYNNICYRTKSNYGTDISLNDRKYDFINLNKTVCQEDCDFAEYNYSSTKAKCSCKINETPSSIIYMNINTTKLLKNFKDINNIANTKILICYKELFTKKGIINNIGFFIMTIILLFHIICMFIYFFKQLKIIIKLIKDITFGLENYHLVEKSKKPKKDKIKKKERKNQIDKKEIKNKIKKEIKPKNKNIVMNLVKNKKSNYFADKKLMNRKNKVNNIILKNNNNNIIDKKKPNNSKKNNQVDNQSHNRILKSKVKKDIIKKDIIKKVNNIMKYNEDEINNLPYDKAVLNDKRAYSQYYISLIRTKHNLVYIFCNNDYNSKIIKINLFIFSFTIYFTVSAMFFDDETMHIIYKNKGSYDLEYQLTKIIYSSLISTLLNSIIKFLALSNGDIVEYKQNKTNKKILCEKEIKLIQKVKIKSIFYFIISFIFLLFFSYYISMFCFIFQNTQYILIKDNLISFGLSLLYPFAIYLAPGIFRKLAISNTKKKRKYLYKFSKFLKLF